MKLNKILLPTDFSLPSDAALEVAETLAQQSGATLLIVHVWDPSQDSSDQDELAADVRRQLSEQLESWRPTRPGLKVEHAVLDGVASDEILRCAARDDVDLIIMGSHGRKGLSRALVGSVLSAVLHHASCNVLAVRPRVTLRGDTKAWAHRKKTIPQSATPETTR